MTGEGTETTGGREAKVKAHKFLGSLKDALLAAGRDEQPAVPPPLAPPAPAAKSETDANASEATPRPSGPSAEEAARIARTAPAADARAEPIAAQADSEGPPTTRVLRADKARAPSVEPSSPRTVLVRGKQQIARDGFERDPVVGFLIVVGGPGLGAFRPVFEGNNTIGRLPQNRIPLDFGDDAISGDAQAYLRYDSNDRSFLFVPNLAKTNVVSVNEKRPTGAVPLQPMDVITLGRTQVAFLPFCGGEFDWSEISQA